MNSSQLEELEDDIQVQMVRTEKRVRDEVRPAGCFMDFLFIKNIPIKSNNLYELAVLYAAASVNSAMRN